MTETLKVGCANARDFETRDRQPCRIARNIQQLVGATRRQLAPRRSLRTLHNGIATRQMIRLFGISMCGVVFLILIGMALRAEFYGSSH